MIEECKKNEQFHSSLFLFMFHLHEKGLVLITFLASIQLHPFMHEFIALINQYLSNFRFPFAFYTQRFNESRNFLKKSTLNERLNNRYQRPCEMYVNRRTSLAPLQRFILIIIIDLRFGVMPLIDSTSIDRKIAHGKRS